MILLDTGYLVALINPRDALHERAVAWGAYIRDQMLVTEQVLWEVLNYFSQPAHRERAHVLVDQILSDSAYAFVPASGRLLMEGRQFHRRYRDKAWSLTDCISFVLMHERSFRQALAHDVHSEQAGFEALLRRDPPSE